MRYKNFGVTKKDDRDVLNKQVTERMFDMLTKQINTQYKEMRFRGAKNYKKHPFCSFHSHRTYISLALWADELCMNLIHGHTHA